MEALWESKKKPTEIYGKILWHLWEAWNSYSFNRTILKTGSGNAGQWLKDHWCNRKEQMDEPKRAESHHESMVWSGGTEPPQRKRRKCEHFCRRGTDHCSDSSKTPGGCGCPGMPVTVETWHTAEIWVNTERGRNSGQRTDHIATGNNTKQTHYSKKWEQVIKNTKRPGDKRRLNLTAQNSSRTNK